MTAIAENGAITHPLERLTADEIRAARALVDKAGLQTLNTRYAFLALEEPPKHEVLAFRPGDPIDRRVRAVLLDIGTGQARNVVVSLTRAEVDSVLALDPAVDGQPPILLEEFIAVDEIVKADEGWVAAMARRGLTDLDLIRPCPLSAGGSDLPDEPGHRMP